MSSSANSTNRALQEILARLGAIEASIGTVKGEVRELRAEIVNVADRLESLEELEVAPPSFPTAARTRTTSSAATSITGPQVSSHSPALLHGR